MGQKVRDAEHRIVLGLADGHAHHFAVLLRDHAVQRQRPRDPLILLQPAVIVRVQIGQIAVLVERILLDVDARGVDVRAEYVHALLQQFAAQHKGEKGLVHPVQIDARAGRERRAGLDRALEIHKAARLRRGHALLHTFALRLGPRPKRRGIRG